MAENKNESPEGAIKKVSTAIPGDNAEDVEGHGKRAKWDGSPEGAIKKVSTAIPDGNDDDVEGHGIRAKWDGGPEGYKKAKWDGGPEGYKKAKWDGGPEGNNEDDVEGHVFDLSRGTGGELIDRKIPGGDSPHGEGVGAKTKL